MVYPRIEFDVMLIFNTQDLPVVLITSLVLTGGYWQTIIDDVLLQPETTQNEKY